MAMMERILRLMADKKASDVYLSARAPAMIRINGNTIPINANPLPIEGPETLLGEVLPAARMEELRETGELNMGLIMDSIGNFRVSAMRQRGSIAAVIRYIAFEIPLLKDLGVPAVLSDIIMEKRGLVLMVGSTGAGKSTTLASMIDHRARNSQGHILTIEDPIEYLFTHDRCTVDQREVGIDTHSFADALRNAMRQAPDIIMIGEIRDRETMEHAIAYAETGHLCVSTLHAANASQALKRIINFFPENLHPQLRMDLSLNLQAIISQRLLSGHEGKRVLATELLLHSAYVADLILKGAVDEIRHAIEKSGGVGMHTFDQVLLELFNAGRIDQDTALANADSRTDLSLRMRVHSAYDPR